MHHTKRAIEVLSFGNNSPLECTLLKDWLELHAEVARLEKWKYLTITQSPSEAACRTLQLENDRLREAVKAAHREGCLDGLGMSCHSDAWDESEAKRAITIPEGE